MVNTVNQMNQLIVQWVSACNLDIQSYC
jgi:hypothetical protein